MTADGLRSSPLVNETVDPKDKRAQQEGQDEVCFICLDGASHEAPLLSPCACPRAVHRVCLARWQLQSAGKKEVRGRSKMLRSKAQAHFKAHDVM